MLGSLSLTNNSNQLMACFVELSSNREKATLEQSVVKTLCQLLNHETYLIRLYDKHRQLKPCITIVGSSACEITTTESELTLISPEFPEQLKCFLTKLSDCSPKEICVQDPLILWPLYSEDVCINVLAIKNSKALVIDSTLLNAIGCIYTNFLSLLEAGERDALTGLYNRRMFDTRLSSLARSIDLEHSDKKQERRYNRESENYLGIIDIDYFKRVNDDYGHLFGDEVLLWLAQNMRHCFRDEDSLFRYGGEEFAVLLSGLNQLQAQEVFERFRKIIESANFPQIGQITVSIGYSCIDRKVNPTLVFGDADKALYYAKEHGRNRVECYELLIKNKQLKQDCEDTTDIELF